MSLEISYDIFKTWKIAYKNCKKQASYKIKDIYDIEFLDSIRSKYKQTLKGKIEMTFDNLIGFFNAIIEYSNSYLQSEKRWSKFYVTNRKKAVIQLLNESKKMVTLLNQQMNTAKNEYDQKGFFAKVVASPVDGSSPVKIEQHIPCITAIVMDIPYTGTNFSTIRCYILVKGSGQISRLNSDFDFRNYKLNDNKSYSDKDFKSRSLFKVVSIPINMPIGIGSIKLDIFISPNDLTSKIALKAISIGEVDINKELLSSSEL